MKEMTSKQMFCACIERIRSGSDKLTEEDVKLISTLVVNELIKDGKSSFLSSSINAYRLDDQIFNELKCLEISKDEVFNNETTLKIEELYMWLSLIHEHLSTNGDFTSNPYARFISDLRILQENKNLPGERECAYLIGLIDILLGDIKASNLQEAENDVSEQENKEADSSEAAQIQETAVSEEVDDTDSEPISEDDTDENYDDSDDSDEDYDDSDEDYDDTDEDYDDTDEDYDDTDEDYDESDEENTAEDSANEDDIIEEDGAEDNIIEEITAEEDVVEEDTIRNISNDSDTVTDVDAGEDGDKTDDAEEKARHIIENAQSEAERIIKAAEQKAAELLKEAEIGSTEYLDDYVGFVKKSKKNTGMFVKNDRAGVRKEVVTTRSSIDRIKQSLDNTESVFKNVENAVASISKKINDTVYDITGKLNDIASEIEYKSTENALSQFSQIYDQICATYNAYRYNYNGNTVPKYDILNRLSMFQEIIELCLEDHGLSAFETPIGEKFDVRLHRAKTQSHNYDPRASYVTKSLKKGFMWGDVVKLKEEVEIGEMEAGDKKTEDASET